MDLARWTWLKGHAGPASAYPHDRLRGGPTRFTVDALIQTLGKTTMAWTTPTLVEICIGLEINGYLPAEF
jgi:coenzyme PQQ precursor peptide PqqA